MMEGTHYTRVQGISNIPECKFPGCKNKIMILTVNYAWLDSQIAVFFKHKQWKSKREKLRNILQGQSQFSGCSYCEKHEEQLFGTYLKKYCKDEGCRNSMKKFLSREENAHMWSLFYTKLCPDREDNLLASCRDLAKTEMNNVDDKNKAIMMPMDGEFIWFTIEDYYSVPPYWKKNFQVQKYLGVVSKEQGVLNGPDFIFKDKKTDETIGFEIFELNKTMFSAPNIKDKEKFMNMMEEQIQSRGGSFENNLRTAFKELDRKIQKWSKYQSTDKKAAGIIVNQSVPDEWYIFMELVINETNKYKDFFSHVYFL